MTIPLFRGTNHLRTVRGVVESYELFLVIRLLNLHSFITVVENLQRTVKAKDK